MSIVIEYQRLLEIRTLHEYYLLGPMVFPDPTTNQFTKWKTLFSFFDLPKSEKERVLKNRVLWNQYHLRADLQIEPTEKTKRILKGLKWHFLQTTAGFALAASVVPIKLANNSPAKKPAIAPASNTQLLFYIRSKNQFFSNFTTLPLRRKTPQPIYYFTNSAQSVSGTDFASLSAPVTEIQANRNYEMGDLALIGGALKEALQNTDGNNTTTHWRDIAGDGYLNESDRICLPKTFNYPFKASDNVQSVTFTLAKPDGTPINPTPTVTIEGDAASPVTNASVQFKPVPPDGHYRLIIDTGTTPTNLQVFLTDAYDPTALGIVHLNLDESDPMYRILGAEGEARNENTDPATKPIPPVFEIRLRSRRTIWRYLSHFNTRRIRPDNLDDHLAEEGNSAITLEPQPFTLLPMGVSSPTAGIDPVALPKADPAALKPRPPDLLYTDIRTFRTTGLNEENI